MKTSTCCFFGHRHIIETEELKTRLTLAIEKLITEENTDTFYVGHQGDFDSMVFRLLLKLRESYPHISISVVLAYLPSGKLQYDLYQGCSIYPEGIETGLPRFAIDRRNIWMISWADLCLCYVNEPWGGAYKFAVRAKKQGLKVINIGSLAL